MKTSTNGTDAKEFVAPDVVKVLEPSESILLPGNRTNTVININFIAIIGKKQTESYEFKAKNLYADPKGDFLIYGVQSLKT